MREIEFRVWNKYSKCIETWDTLVNDFFYNFKDENYDYQQFTGLYDRDGKKIYEGDVVGDDVNHLYEVKFENGSFVCIDAEGGRFLQDVEDGGVWVHGNIHENPELK